MKRAQITHSNRLFSSWRWEKNVVWNITPASMDAWQIPRLWWIKKSEPGLKSTLDCVRGIIVWHVYAHPAVTCWRGGKNASRPMMFCAYLKKKKRKEIQRQRANRKAARLMKTTTVRGWRASVMLRMLRDKHRANTRGALKPIIRAFCLGVHWVPNWTAARHECSVTRIAAPLVGQISLNIVSEERG